MANEGPPASDTPPEPDPEPSRPLSGVAWGSIVGPGFIGSGEPANPISRLAPSIVSVQDTIALGDANLRKWVALAIVTTFVLANAIVLAGVWLMFQQEVAALRDHVYGAADRVITSHLLMALVGATTVQLGALTILMGKYLFPAPTR
jgi:hypothetical protein